ncbi:hypothetical protein BDV96DRAFT_194749 [Lophiotrema nucula]|uniref:Uncharacterized protein n=1 Tax=Lophiotrema nucula TaxID=690887 RepID=A0A6A5YV61_9PLEO|nr:hypothetical protein BDV96DRAFT_194749 [Lophiotrema nucula]
MPRLRAPRRNLSPDADAEAENTNNTNTGVPDTQVILPESPRVMPTELELELELDLEPEPSVSVSVGVSVGVAETYLHPEHADSQLSLATSGMSLKSGAGRELRSRVEGGGGGRKVPFTEQNWRVFNSWLERLEKESNGGGEEHPSGFWMRKVDRKYKFPIRREEYDGGNYIWWRWRCCNDRCSELNTCISTGVFVRKEEKVSQMGDGYDERYGMGDEGVAARTQVLLHHNDNNNNAINPHPQFKDGKRTTKHRTEAKSSKDEKTIKRVLPYIGQLCTRCGHAACRPYVEELPGCALVDVGKWVYNKEGEAKVYGQNHAGRGAPQDGRPLDWAWQWWESPQTYRSWEEGCGQEERERSMRDDYYVYRKRGVRSMNKPKGKWIEVGSVRSGESRI